MGDCVDTSNGVVKCTIFGNILDSDELKPITIMGKFVVEECALGQGANCAAYRVACFEILIHDPDGEEAICACDKNFGWGRYRDHCEGKRHRMPLKPLSLGLIERSLTKLRLQIM